MTPTIAGEAMLNGKRFSQIRSPMHLPHSSSLDDLAAGKFSAGRDQAIGLVRREVTGRGGLDVTLEVANRCPGFSPEDAVHRPFVIIQAT